MKLPEIEKYLDELEKRLRRYKFQKPDDAIARVTDNLRENILSLIKIWDQAELRKTVLITGLEEALFYEPPVKVENRSFVVVAIRNSLIEDLASYDTGSLGMTRRISDDDIKEITRHAVTYFAKVDFGKLADEFAQQIQENDYAEALDKYPVAKAALMNLANHNRKIIEYEPVPSPLEKDFIFSETEGEKIFLKHKGNDNLITTSGISPYIDDKLIDTLKLLYDDKVEVVYFDCFKMLTRNFKKLIKVLEFVLINDGLFVTSNYLMRNGYLEKRTNLIRPAHGMADLEKNLKNRKGISKQHATILESITTKI